MPKDIPQSHALTFEILRDNLDLFVCSLSPEETLNSKQASFPDTEKVLKGVLHAFHGLPGKQYETWKSCYSLLIPFVFKENGGVLFCCFFFFMAMLRSLANKKRFTSVFPQPSQSWVFACHVLFNLISVTIILHVKWVPAMFLL